MALCLLLSIAIYSVAAADEAGGDGTAEDLYRIEDGVLVIDWSPAVGFSPSFDGVGDNLSMEGTENNDLNASLGAHLGWASWDPQADSKGRHAEYGRRVTDLVGIFSIEMEIKLGSNLSSCPGTTEWIPCL